MLHFSMAFWRRKLSFGSLSFFMAFHINLAVKFFSLLCIPRTILGHFLHFKFNLRLSNYTFSPSRNEIYVSAFLQGSVVRAFRLHLWAFSCYFTPCQSNMAAETTSGFSYDSENFWNRLAVKYVATGSKW